MKTISLQRSQVCSLQRGFMLPDAVAREHLLWQCFTVGAQCVMGTRKGESLSGNICATSDEEHEIGIDGVLTGAEISVKRPLKNKMNATEEVLRLSLAPSYTNTDRAFVCCNQK